MRKSRAVLLTVILALVAAAAVFYLLYLSPRALTSRAVETLRQGLDARVTLGRAYFSPVTGLTLAELRVTRKDGGGPLFRARRVFLKPDWLALARFRFVIRKMSLQDAELTLAKDASGNWNWKDAVKKEVPPGKKIEFPVFSLRNGTLRVGDRSYRGVNCELTAFPSKYLIAVRGTVDDPLWGRYVVHGDVNVKDEKLTVSLESLEDFNVTEEWMLNFPLVGKKTWERYRPEGLFGFTGKVSLCWGDACPPDYNLIFEAKDSSCKWLFFPVTDATGMLFVSPRSVIVNNLDGTLFRGDVEGYSIVNLKAPFTFFSRYGLHDIDMSDFLKDFQTAEKSLRGKGSGWVAFHGDHSLDVFRGQGELNVPDARLWKFPIILKILSQLQLSLRREEPRQDCHIVYSFSQKGLTFKEISLVSPVFDIYGEGTAKWDGSVNLRFYVRPVSKTPIMIADILLQPALDSLSGNIAQFRITGTVRDPAVTIIPLTPLSKQIANFFDAVTTRRQKR